MARRDNESEAAGVGPERLLVPPEERALTRRVAWVMVLAAVLGWAMLITGAVVFDHVGRDRISRIVAERMQTMLGLAPEHPIAVEVGGGPLVLQLFAQRLESVVVSTQDVSLGKITGDVRLSATGVPLDMTQPFDRVEAQVFVDEKFVAEVASSVTNAIVTSVELEEPLVRLGTTVKIAAVEVFGIVIIPGFSFDVGIGMEPFVTEGKIAFTPVSFEVGGNELSAEDFADAYRTAAQTLMQVGAICVADQLPAVLALESVAVKGNELVIGLGAENVVFSNEALATRGECSR